jgi:hypothetical protein
MTMDTSPEAIERASAALTRKGGTFLKRHACEIARAAVEAPSLSAAIARVHDRIGHTTVGSRNADAWATIAWNAAAGDAKGRDTACERCGGPTVASDIPGVRDCVNCNADMTAKGW